MGRSLSNETIALLPLRVLSRFVTVDVFWPQGVISRWAGTSATVNGSTYKPNVLRSSPLRMSQGRPADRVEIVVANTDRSVTALNREAALYEANPIVIVGKLYRDPHAAADDPWAWERIFTGELDAAITDQSEASLQILSDIYAAPQVGATRTTTKHCGFRYRDPETCAYDGPLPTCSFDFLGPNGCEGHANQHHGGHFLINTSNLTITLPPPETGGFPGGGGGEPGPIDGGPGRIFDPVPLPSY